MNKIEKTKPPEAVIMWANYHMFSPGQVRRCRRIQSRNLLWCRGGAGVLRINGTDYPMQQPGSFVFTPMDFSATYQADSKNPFYVGGIHLLPASSCDLNPPFTIYHASPTAETSFPEHDPFEIDGMEQTISGTFQTSPQLEHLIDYIVRWFNGPLRNKDRAVTLARLLIDELAEFTKGRPVSASGIPPLLLQIQCDIEARLNQRLTLNDLAEKAGCSPSTVTRLFQKTICTPPMHWVNERRMEKATELLRTTTLRVGEIGVQVGIEDPYHFSKLFRKFYGISARKYRREHGAL